MWLFMSWLEERVDPSLHPQRSLYAGSTLSGPSSFLSDWPALRDTHRVQSVPVHNQDYLPAWKACKINHKIHGHDPFLTSTLGDRTTHMVALGQIYSKLVQSLTNHSTESDNNRKQSNKHSDYKILKPTRSFLKGNIHQVSLFHLSTFNVQKIWQKKNHILYTSKSEMTKSK